MPKAKSQAVMAAVIAQSAPRTITEIPLAQIERSPYQTRADVANEDLTESIRQDGLLSPIAVRVLPVPSGDTVRYELVSGESRLTSVKELGWETIPAEVFDGLTDEGAYRLHLAENLKRRDLNPIEEARCFQVAVEKFGWTVGQVAESVSRSRELVEKRLALLDLPESYRQLVVDGAPVSRVQQLAPLAQFGSQGKGIKTWTAEMVQARSADQLEREVEDYVERHAEHIDGWDPELCRAAGCYAEFTVRWPKKGDLPFCTDPAHAMTLRLQAQDPAVEQALAKVPEAGLLPIYYDLAGARPRAYGQAKTGKTPQGFSLSPLKEPRDFYGDQKGHAYELPRLKREITADDYKASCAACPAFGDKEKPGRYVLVRFTSQDMACGGLRPIVSVVCADYACRQKLRGKKSKGTPAAEGSLSPAALRNVVAQDLLAAAATAAVRRLVDDPARLLAATLLRRDSSKDVPAFWAGGFGGVLAEITGHRLHHYDEYSARAELDPHAYLAAVMAEFGPKLTEALATFALRDFDNAWTSPDYKKPRAWTERRLRTTLDVLFGAETSAALKAAVDARMKEWRASRGEPVPPAGLAPGDHGDTDDEATSVGELVERAIVDEETARTEDAESRARYEAATASA